MDSNQTDLDLALDYARFGVLQLVVTPQDRGVTEDALEAELYACQNASADERDLSLPPHSDAAEAALLGSLFHDPTCLAQVSVDLQPESFHHPRHRVVFAAMLACAYADMEPDLPSVTARLELLGTLEQAGGLDYLFDLDNAVASPMYVNQHARIVADAARARQAISTAQTMAERAYRIDFDGVQAAAGRALELSQPRVEACVVQVQGRWHITWPGLPVAVQCSRLEATRDGLRAEVALLDERQHLRSAPVLVNLLGLEVQSRLAANLLRVAPGYDWRRLLNDGLRTLITEWRTLGRPKTNADIPLELEPITMLWPGVARRHATLYFGPGGSLKTITSMAQVLALPRTERVLWIDYETDDATFFGLLRRVASGMGVEVGDNIIYRGRAADGSARPMQPIELCIDELLELVLAERISVVVIDSISRAVIGSLVDDEVAIRTVGLLDRLAPATRVCIGHVNRTDAVSVEGESRPFGSVFFTDQMRATFEVRAVDTDDPSRHEVGVYHRKPNLSEREVPRYLVVTFDGPTGPIGVQPAAEKVAAASKLVAFRGRAPLTQSEIILRELGLRGRMTTGQVAAELSARLGREITSNIARARLSELGKKERVVQLEAGGDGAGDEASWGLRA